MQECQDSKRTMENRDLQSQGDREINPQVPKTEGSNTQKGAAGPSSGTWSWGPISTANLTGGQPSHAHPRKPSTLVGYLNLGFHCFEETASRHLTWSSPPKQETATPSLFPLKRSQEAPPLSGPESPRHTIQDHGNSYKENT